MDSYSMSAAAPGDDRPRLVVATPASPSPKEPVPLRRKLLRVFWLFVILAAGALVYQSQKAQSNRPAKVAAGVKVATVSLGEVDAIVEVSGTVAAMNSASLLAPRILGSRSGLNRGGDTNFGGPAGGAGGANSDFNLVLLSLAKAGTPVQAGDVVAQFDTQNQVLRRDDYRDSVVQLENNLKSLTANLAAIKEAHDQSVAAARAAWDQAVLDLQTAPVHSDIDVQKYKLAVEETEATYKQLQHEASLVEASQRAQVRVQELGLEQARIELQRAENSIQKMTIKAPMKGIVVMASIVRNGEFGQIREGDQVNAGQPFVSIVDPSSMVLNANVNQVDAERLRLGMKAAIRLDAYPDVNLPGTLTGVGAMSKESTFRATYVGEIPIRVRIDRLDPHLIPELTGSATVVVNSESNALVAPRTAVVDEGGNEFVMVKDADTWRKKQVQVGLESFTSVAIHSGLQQGDTIALQPAALMTVSR